MRKSRDFHHISSRGFRPCRLPFVTLILIFLLGGCSSRERFQARPIYQEANAFFSAGGYHAALEKYTQIIEEFPSAADDALFQAGIIYAHPKNGQRDYNRALETFRKLIEEYQTTERRHDARMMLFYIENVIIKDQIIAQQQMKIGALQQDIAKRQVEITTFKQQIDSLEQKITALKTASIDKILVEKKKRQLKLISRGEVIKAYRIALGGNPDGPKEKQGDNKTPEGSYFIDAKNKDSRYHLSLHISYPNEKDIQRAKELGVSPGGDIMIHGIKNGFSWVGDAHQRFDWTKGCIALTDAEIEEIYRIVPVGTMVEIRP